jgi:hypothetical protein
LRSLFVWIIITTTNYRTDNILANAYGVIVILAHIYRKW